jgi:uncharacterized protein (TIGR03083 family)
MTHDAGLQPVVAETFLALADLLDAMGETRWDTASLCEQWRVREVVAHLTMAARYSEDAFMAELRECGFDFPRLSNRIAGRDAALPTAELVANLRADVLHHWTPPGGGYHDALTHVVIHSLDVTVPLGLARPASDEAVLVVLDALAAGGHKYFGVEIAGRAPRATDIAWSFGQGSPLRGTAGDLVLALSGRRLPGARLEGEPL